MPYSYTCAEASIKDLRKPLHEAKAKLAVATKRCSAAKRLMAVKEALKAAERYSPRGIPWGDKVARAFLSAWLHVQLKP